MVDNNGFYKAHLLDHYQSPRNWGTIDLADFSSGQVNPSCGDSISITGCVQNNTVTKLAFTGAGCVISLATASMLTEFCVGKSIDEIMQLTVPDMLRLINIDLGPVRIKCALLPLQALQQGLVSSN